MSEYKGIDYLRNQLSAHRHRIEKRYEFYEMKHLAEDLKISTPPSLRRMGYVL